MLLPPLVKSFYDERRNAWYDHYVITRSLVRAAFPWQSRRIRWVWAWIGEEVVMLRLWLESPRGDRAGRKWQGLIGNGGGGTDVCEFKWKIGREMRRNVENGSVVGNWDEPWLGDENEWNQRLIWQNTEVSKDRNLRETHIHLPASRPTNSNRIIRFIFD